MAVCSVASSPSHHSPPRVRAISASTSCRTDAAGSPSSMLAATACCAAVSSMASRAASVGGGLQPSRTVTAQPTWPPVPTRSRSTQPSPTPRSAASCRAPSRARASFALRSSTCLAALRSGDAIERRRVAVELGHGEPRRRLHLGQLLGVPVHLGLGRAAAHARQADAERAERAVLQLVVREVGCEGPLPLGGVVRRAGHVLRGGEQHARHRVRHEAHLAPHILRRRALRQRLGLHAHHFQDLGHHRLQLVGGHLQRRLGAHSAHGAGLRANVATRERGKGEREERASAKGEERDRAPRASQTAATCSCDPQHDLSAESLPHVSLAPSASQSVADARLRAREEG
eukprot:7391812-Prymnesium_polylepis.2